MNALYKHQRLEQRITWCFSPAECRFLESVLQLGKKLEAKEPTPSSFYRWDPFWVGTEEEDSRGRLELESRSLYNPPSFFLYLFWRPKKIRPREAVFVCTHTHTHSHTHTHPGGAPGCWRNPSPWRQPDLPFDPSPACLLPSMWPWTKFFTSLSLTCLSINLVQSS